MEQEALCFKLSKLITDNVGEANNDTEKKKWDD